MIRWLKSSILRYSRSVLSHCGYFPCCTLVSHPSIDGLECNNKSI